MGGCQSCKLSDLDSQWFEGTFKTYSDNDNQSNSLLSNQERHNLQQNVYIHGIPIDYFWESNSQYKHVCFKQIKKDILRTFPDLPFFGNIHNINRFELLLQKFAIYFPRVGYTQGINFLAGYILLCGFDDDNAFDFLVRISLHDKILALGLYQDQFPLNRFYCQVFWKLLQKKMPKVAQKLQIARVPDQAWIFQWFISFYLYSFPLQYMKHFWGYILSKKQFSLVLLALGIVRCLKKDLLEISGYDEFQYFQYFDTLKSLEICKIKIDPKKATSYAKTITKSEIDQAILCTQCHNNPYKRYFLSNNNIQQEKWQSIIKKHQSDRLSFKMNPNSAIYIRNRQTTQHLQNFVIEKIKLYRSDFRMSKANFLRQSNFSIGHGISKAHSVPQQNIVFPKNSINRPLNQQRTKRPNQI